VNRPRQADKAFTALSSRLIQSFQTGFKMLQKRLPIIDPSLVSEISAAQRAE
jgi:hypothetical protein